MDQNNETNPSEEKRQMSLLLNIGSKLRDARVAMSMSVEDAADYLRVSPKVIQSIESDAYQREDLNTFTRGYIRSYARLVHVPLEKVEKAFEQIGLQTKVEQHTVTQTVPSMAVCAYKRRPVYYLLIGVLAFFIVVGYVSHHFRTNNTAVEVVKIGQIQPLSSENATTDASASASDASQPKQQQNASTDQSSQTQVPTSADVSKQDQTQQSQVSSNAAPQNFSSNTSQQVSSSTASVPSDAQPADVKPAQSEPAAKPWVDPDAVSDTTSEQQQ